MITQYQRRRNQNPAFTVQKQNYRIQVDGSTKTWKLAKKTQTTAGVGSLNFSIPANSMYIPVFPL